MKTKRTSNAPGASDPPSTLSETRAIVAAVKAALSSAAYAPPVLPSLLSDLLLVSKDAEIELKAIHAVLERDPFLTARVLRMAQSAVYGSVMRPMLTLDEALARLGVSQATEVCWEAATRLRVFHVPVYEDALEQIGRHSTATAHVARHLAGRFVVDADVAFLAGLLHDLGLAAALVVLADLPGRPNPPQSVDDLWPYVTEASTGAALAVFRGWGLSPELAQVAMYHHDPAPPVDRLTALVALANWAASSAGFGLAGDDDPPPPAALVALSLNEDDPRPLADEAKQVLARLHLD